MSPRVRTRRNAPGSRPPSAGTIDSGADPRRWWPHCFQECSRWCLALLIAGAAPALRYADPAEAVPAPPDSISFALPAVQSLRPDSLLARAPSEPPGIECAL